MMNGKICAATDCRLPALFNSEYCRGHLPDARRYFQQLPSQLASASGAMLARVDLSALELRDVDLSSAVLSGALLEGTIISDSVLTRAVMRGVSLRTASFDAVDARGCDLSAADCSGGHFQHILLDEAIAIGSYWDSAELSGSRIIPC